MKQSWRAVELDEREAAFCAYAEKLSLEPASIEPSDLDPLRAVGLDDVGILHLAHVVGFFAYANRIVEGLGCAVESVPTRQGKKK